jgi:AcrR family transcriptional regulator
MALHDGSVPRPKSPTGRTGRPPVTSRAQILAAARQLIDRDGWDKLTVRRLAAELGIGPTTLYHHVRDKEDLLLLVLNEYVGQVPQPDLPSDPAERIVVSATAMHDALAAWPWALEVLTVDGFLGRLDDSARWIVEVVLAAAVDAGCTPEQAVHVFRSIWYYTAGEILVRAHSAHVRGEDGQALDRSLQANLNATQLPHLASVANKWSVLAAEDDYEPAVRAFVTGLLAQVGR